MKNLFKNILFVNKIGKFKDFRF